MIDLYRESIITIGNKSFPNLKQINVQIGGCRKSWEIINFKRKKCQVFCYTFSEKIILTFYDIVSAKNCIQLLKLEALTIKERGKEKKITKSFIKKLKQGVCEKSKVHKLTTKIKALIAVFNMNRLAKDLAYYDMTEDEVNQEIKEARLFGKYGSNKRDLSIKYKKYLHWFWTKKWQKGEREAGEDVKKGRITRFKNVKEMKKHFDK